MTDTDRESLSMGRYFRVLLLIVLLGGFLCHFILSCGSLPVCASNADCALPLKCQKGRCQAACTQNRDCPSEQQCNNLQCVATKAPNEPPLSCKVKQVSPQQTGETELTIECEGKSTKVTLPKEEKTCPACKQDQRCNDGVCWSKGSEFHPASSCKDILDTGNSSGDGVYWIDEDEEGPQKPFQVYCDMTTDRGGWTLCLNSRYTMNAKHLFVTKYEKIYPDNNGPFGYYDFCPQGKREYRQALAEAPGAYYSYRIVDFKLLGADPQIQLNGDTKYWGVISKQAKWLTKPAGSDVGPAPEAIYFWYLTNPTTGQGTTASIFRGFSPVTELPKYNAKDWGFVGAGCHNFSACLLFQRRYHRDVYGNFQYFSLLSSYMHFHEPEKKVKVLLRADRVQVLYR